MLRAEVDAIHGLIHLPPTQGGERGIGKGIRLRGQNACQGAKGLMQLPDHQRCRGFHIFGIKNSILQLRRQAARGPAALAHLLRDALPGLATLQRRILSVALFAIHLRVLLLLLRRQIQIRICSRPQHDLRIDAGGRQGPHQVLHQLFTYGSNGIIEGTIDEISDHRRGTHGGQMLREEWR